METITRRGNAIRYERNISILVRRVFFPHRDSPQTESYARQPSMLWRCSRHGQSMSTALREAVTEAVATGLVSCHSVVARPDQPWHTLVDALVLQQVSSSTSTPLPPSCRFATLTLQRKSCYHKQNLW